MRTAFVNWTMKAVSIISLLNTHVFVHMK